MSRLPAMRRMAALLACAAAAAAQFDPALPALHVSLEAPGLSGNPPLVVRDVDLDGTPDLIASGNNQVAAPAALVCARGKPGGGFEAPLVSDTAKPGAIALAVDALDGDAFPDVAWITVNHKVGVAHGLGGGVFNFGATYFVGNGTLQAIAIADVNHDGTNDLITGGDEQPGWLDVNLADGTGGYLATQAWPAGLEPRDLAAGDLDGDGWVDVVACSDFASTLAVVLNDGAGGFLAPAVFTASSNPTDLLLAPLDGDADLDVLACCPGQSLGSQGFVRPWFGDGAGGLSPGLVATTGHDPASAALADLDDDGDLDACASCGGDPSVGVLVNDGSGGFTSTALVPCGEAAPVVNVADVTNDGHLDLVLGVAHSRAWVIPGNADGTFPAGSVWSNNKAIVAGLDAALIDGDEWPDILFAGSGPPPLGVLLGKSDGFQPEPIVNSLFLTAFDARAGDLDGDGLADAVTSAVLSDVPRLEIGFGLGNGAFKAPHDVLWTAPNFAQRLALADLNGDGWRDVVGLEPLFNSHVLAFLNGGASSPGQLAAPTITPVGHIATRMQLGDLDGDGVVDLAAIQTPGGGVPYNSLLTLLGAGDGTWSSGPISALPGSHDWPRDLALGDFDLDGRLDAAVAIRMDGVVLALGDGAGGFVSSPLYEPEGMPSEIVAGDVDGDGLPDVVHGGKDDEHRLVLRRGDGAGGFLPPESYSTSDACTHLLLVDVTHDGQPEVVLSDLVANPVAKTHVQLLPNIKDPFVWKDLGSALAGALGEPRLSGTGALLPGTPGQLKLTVAKPSSLAALFVSGSSTPAPFKGGTLVPVPPILIGFLVTGADGTISLPWPSWPSNAPGKSWYFQFGVADAGAPHGVALSNAVSGTEPD